MNVGDVHVTDGEGDKWRSRRRGIGRIQGTLMRQINHTRGFCSREGGKAGGFYKPVSPCLKSSERVWLPSTLENRRACVRWCVYLSEQERGGYINGQTCECEKMMLTTHTQ